MFYTQAGRLLQAKQAGRLLQAKQAGRLLQAKQAGRLLQTKQAGNMLAKGDRPIRGPTKSNSDNSDMKYLEHNHPCQEVRRFFVLGERRGHLPNFILELNQDIIIPTLESPSNCCNHRRD